MDRTEATRLFLDHAYEEDPYLLVKAATLTAAVAVLLS